MADMQVFKKIYNGLKMYVNTRFLYADEEDLVGYLRLSTERYLLIDLVGRTRSVLDYLV